MMESMADDTTISSANLGPHDDDAESMTMPPAGINNDDDDNELY